MEGARRGKAADAVQRQHSVDLPNELSFEDKVSANYSLILIRHMV